MKDTILEVKNLSVSFQMYEQGLRQKIQTSVTDMNLSVGTGEILAVAGSSGSGKSLLAHSIFGILPDNAAVTGQIYYQGQLLTEELLQTLRGKKLSLIPQSVNCLDPLMKAGRQIMGDAGEKARMYTVLELLQLPKETAEKYPFQLSGGMKRKVLLATALMGNADLIVADEPTPGLDTAMAVHLLSHFRTLADSGKSVLLITHDIDLACRIADRVAIFHEGTIVEIVSAKDFLAGSDKLKSPYSKQIWQALPENGFNCKKKEAVIDHAS